MPFLPMKSYQNQMSNLGVVAFTRYDDKQMNRQFEIPLYRFDFGKKQ